MIAVDLFGQPADYDAIAAVCARARPVADRRRRAELRRRLRRPQGRHAGAVTTTSFFPAKPLGCYGDGGASSPTTTSWPTDAFDLRVHGKGSDKYDIVRIGMNGRLDTIQAAILIEKLAIFRSELEARDAVAARYSSALRSAMGDPELTKAANKVLGAVRADDL